MHCMLVNSTPANRRTVGELVRVIDPSPWHETITWRLRRPGRPLLTQPIDHETTMREALQGTL